MMELGQTSDPVDLVAGSVAGIDEFSARWRARARIADSIATRLRRLEAPSGWEGTAAAGFASRLPTAFAQWEQLSQSLTTAADALDQYATVLGWAQQKAADAIAMWEAAEVQTAAGIERYRQAERQAGATGIVPFYTDAGAVTRSDAQSLLAYARSEVRDAGDAAADAVSAITPPPPLTRQEQQLLKDRYLLKDRNLNELAEHYHMSRTTLYRHVRLVAEHLWQALGTRME